MRHLLAASFFLAHFQVFAASGDLKAQIERISRPLGGKASVRVLHLESGQGASLNEAERCPMASVFKLPIAVAVMRKVDAGGLDLAAKVPIGLEDVRPGGSIEATFRPGMSLTIDDLLSRMLIESDNTAADVLLGKLGGPKEVEKCLESSGLKGLDISLSELEMMAISRGAPNAPVDGKCAPDCLRKLVDSVPEKARQKAMASFNADPRNTANAENLVTFLAALSNGKLLSPSSTARILNWMVHCQTGDNRIRGLLPKGTVVASKTGTMHGVTNDIGIVTLPGGQGHLLVAVLIKNSRKPLKTQERAIAEIAKAAFTSSLSWPPR